MTGAQFKELIASIPDDCTVVVETRFKTGYDEGDIYHQEPDSIHEYPYSPGEYVLELGRYKLVGGW